MKTTSSRMNMKGFMKFPSGHLFLLSFEAYYISYIDESELEHKVKCVIATYFSEKFAVIDFVCG